MKDKKQKAVYSQDWRNGFDEGYKKGFFDGLKEFRNTQRKVQL